MINNENYNKFIEIFDKIENELKIYVDDFYYKTFKDLLERSSSSSKVIKNYVNQLSVFSDLRNTLVHNYMIAIPTTETIKDMENIYNEIIKPKNVSVIMTKREKIYKASPSSYLKDVIKEMRDKIYTHVPIYDDENFIGIFSETTILKYLADNYESDGCFLIPHKKIGEILEYIDKEDDKINSYEFVSKNLDIYSVKDKFEEYMKNGKRLGVLLITETGKSTEKLLGIVTSWDLNKIIN